MKVSLVVPTYNEAENVVKLLDLVLDAMQGRDFEAWVVDDDSPDGTWRAVESYRAAHPGVELIRRIGKRGLSSAVIDGFSHAKGDVLCVMDADLSHDPALLPRLVDAVEAGADLAVGSRRVAGGGADNWPWYRRGASSAATALTRWWLDVPMRDPMSGYFALKRDVFERARAGMRPKGYKILLELACRAAPLRVVELPFVFKDRKQGVSKVSPRVAREFLLSLWELRGRAGGR
jgi:dolichol-phosphate mannosyltransferase